ncbi:MAG: hypothetical protein ABI221_01460 [Candidatus Saccharimonadales bacterium]
MEQLIVLGEIPGTHLQITFSWFALLVIIGVVVIGYKLHMRHVAQLRQKLQQHYDTIALGSLDKA